MLNTVRDAHCMFCNAPWQREFFDSNLSASFRTKEFKLHRENILCEREKSRLPETQALFDTVKARSDAIKLDLQEINDENAALREKLRVFTLKIQRTFAQNQLRADLNHVRYNRLQDILAGRRDHVDGDEDFVQETRRRAGQFTMQCPLTTCNGLLNERFICSVCSERVCRRCHVSRGKVENAAAQKDLKGKGPAIGTDSDSDHDDDANDDHHEKGTSGNAKHICDPDTLATIKHLRLSSKGCPGCGARISKIDGCDQMWCIGCHTAFSWKTGEKVSARAQVHNPHFYEWKRNNGGLAAGAVDANGCPIGRDVLELASSNIQKVMKAPSTQVLWALYNISQEIVHLQQVEMVPTYEENATDSLRPMRIQYLKGELQEADWKISLQRFEKKRCKRAELLQVYQMYTASMADIFRKIAAAKEPNELEVCRKEMMAMCSLTTSCMSTISQRYGQTCGYRTYAAWEEVLSGSPYFIRSKISY